MVEVVQLLPVRSSIKGSTYVDTIQPEVDVILSIDHGILTEGESEALATHDKKGRTLIMVKRTLTKPKAALAGGMPEISFAKFAASIATFSFERIAFRLFSRLGFAVIFEAGGRGEKQRVGTQAQVCR
jgi:hypothetical protein